jgi:hypothetical protein
LLVAVAMLCLDGTRDGDLYLQLASGRFIATHGFSAVDPFQTIAHGEPWLNQQWLNELLIYHVVRWIGVTGLTVAYAGLLAIPLALLLWLCRHKGIWMMTVLTVLYCPGLWMIVHPRAAGFSVLAFSALVAILVSAWLRQRPKPMVPARLHWALPATLAIFAIWANLHGGFVAGLVLIGVVVCGLLLERRLALDSAGPRRIGLLVLTGLLATATVTLATPLGGELWPYLASFRNPAISLASSEWRPAIESPLAVVYLGAAAVFVRWLWVRAPGARSLTPVLVVVTFLLLAAISLRNIIFVGPVLAFAVASLAPDRELRIPRSLIGLAVAASAGAALTWAILVGPARNEPILNSRLVDYALRHPPRTGHIAAYAGIGSYMLWCSPAAPVELDGWLEHFTPTELRRTYAVLDGRVADPTRYVRELQIGAVIADRHRAIRVLQAHGFAVEFRSRAGTYLVKREGAELAARQESGAGGAFGNCHRRACADRSVRKNLRGA